MCPAHSVRTRQHKFQDPANHRRGSASSGRLSYSNHRKMRVHLAGTPVVSSWYGDADVSERSDRRNAFLLFTSCFDGCALWCESDDGKGDDAPLPGPSRREGDI